MKKMAVSMYNELRKLQNRSLNTEELSHNSIPNKCNNPVWELQIKITLPGAKIDQAMCIPFMSLS